MKRAWVLGVLALVTTSCAAMLRDEMMTDWPTVNQIMQDGTESIINEKIQVKRLAIIGFAAPAVGSNLLDWAAGIDAAYAAAPEIMTQLGYEVVPNAEVVNHPTYKSMGQDGEFGYSFAKGTRFRIGWDAYTVATMVAGILGDGDTKDPKQLAQINTLIDELKVDGIVTSIFDFRGWRLAAGSLILYTKGPNGQAKLSWRARLKPLKFEVQSGSSGFDNGRLFAHPFRLLAARMAKDLK